MKNLFATQDLNELLARFELLNLDSRRQWGTMTVSQMLAHCTKPLEVALGKAELPQSWFGKLFGGIIKRMLLGEKPFQQNAPTSPSFIIKDNPNFDKEKQYLVTLIKEFAQNNGENIRKTPHPFFGKMTQEEWNTLTYKHLDHHLRQFGC